MPATYDLPWFQGDFVLLTPKDIMTKDYVWINRPELYDRYSDIAFSVPDDQLGYQINDYFSSVLPSNANDKERQAAIKAVIERFPKLLDHYIHEKEEDGEEAVAKSAAKVVNTETLFVQQVRNFVDNRLAGTEFYEDRGDTLAAARNRALVLKRVIQEQEGYKVFYLGNEPIHTEEELQVLYRLVWHATPPGEEPRSLKEQSKSPVEFKLASNASNTFKHLAQALKDSNQSKITIKVIIYMSPVELEKMIKLQNEYGLAGSEYIIPINAQSKEATAASVVSGRSGTVSGNPSAGEQLAAPTRRADTATRVHRRRNRQNADAVPTNHRTTEGARSEERDKRGAAPLVESGDRADTCWCNERAARRRHRGRGGHQFA